MTGPRIMTKNRKTPFEPTIPSLVRCEADRGDPSYVGEAIGISDAVHLDLLGNPYRWVNVRREGGRVAVWPSNRLTPA